MERRPSPGDDPSNALSRLRADVDAEVRRLGDLHEAALHCRRGCHACCLDDLSVLEVEAQSIRRTIGQALRGAQAHPVGGCAFLDDEGACRIYPVRPHVCRTQGLPLRTFREVVSVDPDDFEVVEHRDVCPENRAGIDLSALEDDELLTLGPAELELQRIQASHQGGDRDEPLRRVALRALFLELSGG